MQGSSEVSGVAGSRFATIDLVGTTGSTNADLLAEARAGAPAGRVLIADHQTAGRGRLSRAWFDEPGRSLLMSFLVRLPLERAGLIPLLTGVAVVDAVAEQTAAVVRLKWPNDVVEATGHRKLAGILAEASTEGDQPAVVVGIGLNLLHPSDLPDPLRSVAVDLASLADPSPVPDRLELARAILAGVDSWLDDIERGQHDQLLTRYRHQSATIGRRVTIATVGGEVVGEALDVTGDGALVLSGDGERHVITVGDVSHRSR